MLFFCDPNQMYGDHIFVTKMFSFLSGMCLNPFATLKGRSSCIVSGFQCVKCKKFAQFSWSMFKESHWFLLLSVCLITWPGLK